VCVQNFTTWARRGLAGLSYHVGDFVCLFVPYRLKLYVKFFCSHKANGLGFADYLRQGGNGFASFCLSVSQQDNSKI